MLFPFRSVAIPAIVLALVIPFHCPAARVLLFPNGERIPGEVGQFMGGAQVALTSGTEAAWFNPAGMAKEIRTVATMSGIGLAFNDIHIGGSQGVTVRPTPGFFSFTTTPTAANTLPQFTYGLFVSWPLLNEFPARFEDARTVDQSGLAPTLVGGQNLDMLFPGGIARRETAISHGELRIVSPGIAFGLAFSRWFRAGMSLRWERLHFEERNSSAVLFSAGAPAGIDELRGLTQTSAIYRGSGRRLIYMAGLQFDLGQRIKFGITARLPSRNEEGNGGVFFSQSNTLTVSQSASVTESNEFLLARGDGLRFRLRSPGEIRMGGAVRFDTVAIEVDWIRARAVAGYEVLPAVNGDPSSSRAFQTPPLTTSLNETERFAAGVALAAGDSSAFLFGYARDVSAVPGNDPVFRRIDLNQLAVGYYFSRGPFSASTGMIYGFGEARGIALPQLGVGDSLAGNVTYKSYSLRTGISYIF